MPDTIFAAATAPGGAPRAVVRLSGPEAIAVALSLFAPDGQGAEEGDLPAFRWIDGTVRWAEPPAPPAPAGLVLMRAPRSYTREDMAELHVPGSPPIARGILALLAASGARSAGPGELTRRAFENGRLSLSQAAAVLALIESERPEDHRLALAALAGDRRDRLDGLRARVVEALADLEGSLDLAEEGIDFLPPGELAGRIEGFLSECRALEGEGPAAPRDPVRRVLLVGKANAGKSTLFNRLAGASQIVSDVPGTTRDLAGARLRLGRGIAELVDTPGRLPGPEGEIDRAGRAILERDLSRRPLVVLVLDGSRPWEPEDGALYAACEGLERILAVNKGDLPPRLDLAGRVAPEDARASVSLSARTGEGVPALQEALAGRLEAAAGGWTPFAAEGMALASARGALSAALDDARAGAPGELVAVHLRDAAVAFGPLHGGFASREVLDALFSRFCVGK